jgi:hypothetical protein
LKRALEKKSNEYCILQSKFLELNEEMTKLQEDHSATVCQLNQSLKETEDMKYLLQRNIELNRTSNQNVLFYFSFFLKSSQNNLSSSNQVSIMCCLKSTVN